MGYAELAAVSAHTARGLWAHIATRHSAPRLFHSGLCAVLGSRPRHATLPGKALLPEVFCKYTRASIRRGPEWLLGCGTRLLHSQLTNSMA